jgi:hypothetical protein
MVSQRLETFVDIFLARIHTRDLALAGTVLLNLLSLSVLRFYTTAKMTRIVFTTLLASLAAIPVPSTASLLVSRTASSFHTHNPK